MSIAAMADNRLLRKAAEGEDPKPPDGIPANALNALAQWIPTEAIGLYISAQLLLLDPLPAPAPGDSAASLDYGTRWTVFWIGLTACIVLLWLAVGFKARSGRAPDFAMPVAETFFASVAFALWAFALPDSPAADWDWWDAGVAAFAVILGTTLLNPLAVVLGKKAPFAKTTE